MNTKIIIEVRGGNVVAVSSSEDVDIVIVDYDSPENGDDLIKGVYGQDALFESGKAHWLFADDLTDMAVCKFLKEINF